MVRFATVATLAVIVFALGAVTQLHGAESPGLLLHEFLYESASFPSCHASTIEQTPTGLVTAFFGGADEGEPDVGIWVCRRESNGWSAPVEVANGVQSADKRFPCWNPVLYQAPGGPLMLFYKVGPNPTKWWGMLTTSLDGGKTWSASRRLPDGILGPIKNKPVLYQNVLLCPSSTEDHGWLGHMESTSDLGQTWTKSESFADPEKFSVIQPTILVQRGADGQEKLQLLLRSRKRQIAQTWSSDGGKTWTPLTATELPNPDSGIDAVNLADGRSLLVYNPTTRGRSPLAVAVSSDGKTWQAALPLETEKGEFSYPAVIATPDGKVHVTYTWKRKKIRYAELDPAKFVLQAMPGGAWPK